MEASTVSASLEEAHITLQAVASFTIGLPVSDSSPLLAFDEIGMNLHDLSLSWDRDRTLLFFILGFNNDHPQFSFQDGNYSGWR